MRRKIEFCFAFFERKNYSFITPTSKLNLREREIKGGEKIVFSDQKEDVRTPFHRSLLAPLYSSPVAAMYKTSRIHRKWIGFYRNMGRRKKAVYTIQWTQQ